VVFNNGQETSGCQSGGGNICAVRGKKAIQVSYSSSTPNTASVPSNLPTQPTVGNANFVLGGANPVSWAPHPNPPPLVFPPLCVSPYLGGNEPTSFETIALPPPGPNTTPFGLALTNLLTPGDPFGNPLLGVPPSGLLARQQNTYFEGPSPIRTLNMCVDYMYRQQVGHFLYVLDRARREVVVVNSNRFTVLDRIQVPDPTDLAMGPNLDFLAVSNQSADTVTFIDINPASSSFHQIVKTTSVGRAPRGVAWDPGNEDILVCNELDSSVSVISAFSLDVRNTVQSQLNRPFDVAILQRNFAFGLGRNVYFAFILNRSGKVAIFESGPNGVNGWGYDDIIGTPAFTFENPKKIALDYQNLLGSIWVVHENKLLPDGSQSGLSNEGAVTNIVVDSGLFGQLPLSIFGLSLPQFRDMGFKVAVSVGEEQLTGIPVDIALDDLVNHAALENVKPIQAAGTPLVINGKSVVRPLPGGENYAKDPQYIFLAVPNSTEGPGVVDVISMDAGFRRLDTDAYTPGIQSIPAAGATFLMDYWRQ
jgi:hypothetical protein